MRRSTRGTSPRPITRSIGRRPERSGHPLARRVRLDSRASRLKAPDADGPEGRTEPPAGRGGTDDAHPVPGFEPETDTERRLACDPVLREGWAWGEPRSGHPEGAVGAHVADLLR